MMLTGEARRQSGRAPEYPVRKTWGARKRNATGGLRITLIAHEDGAQKSLTLIDQSGRRVEKPNAQAQRRRPSGGHAGSGVREASSMGDTGAAFAGALG